jgi:hypothetical protein
MLPKQLAVLQASEEETRRVRLGGRWGARNRWATLAVTTTTTTPPAAAAAQALAQWSSLQQHWCRQAPLSAGQQLQASESAAWLLQRLVTHQVAQQMLSGADIHELRQQSEVRRCWGVASVCSKRTPHQACAQCLCWALALSAALPALAGRRTR